MKTSLMLTITEDIFLGFMDEPSLNFFNLLISNQKVTEEAYAQQVTFDYDLSRSETIQGVSQSEHQTYLSALDDYIDALRCARILKQVLYGYMNQHMLLAVVGNLFQRIGTAYGLSVVSPKIEVHVQTVAHNKIKLIWNSSYREINKFNGIEEEFLIKLNAQQPPLYFADVEMLIEALPNEQVLFTVEKYQLFSVEQPNPLHQQWLSEFTEKLVTLERYLQIGQDWVHNLIYDKQIYLPDNLPPDISKMIYRFAFRHNLNGFLFRNVLAKTQRINYGEEIVYAKQKNTTIDATIYTYLPKHYLTIINCDQLTEVQITIKARDPNVPSVFELNLSDCVNLDLSRCKVYSDNNIKVIVKLHVFEKNSIEDHLLFLCTHANVSKLSFFSDACSKQIMHLLVSQETSMFERLLMLRYLLPEQSRSRCIEKLNLAELMPLKKLMTESRESASNLEQTKLLELKCFNQAKWSIPLDTVIHTLNFSKLLWRDSALMDLAYFTKLTHLELNEQDRLVNPEFPPMKELLHLSMENCVQLTGFKIAAPKLKSASFNHCSLLTMKPLVTLAESRETPIETLKLSLQKCASITGHMHRGHVCYDITHKEIEKFPALLAEFSKNIPVQQPVDVVRHLECHVFHPSIISDRYSAQRKTEEMLWDIRYVADDISKYLTNLLKLHVTRKKCFAALLAEIKAEREKEGIKPYYKSNPNTLYGQLILFLLITDSTLFFNGEEISSRNFAMEFLGYYFKHEWYVNRSGFEIVDKFMAPLIKHWVYLLVFHKDPQFCVNTFEFLAAISIDKSDQASIRERARLVYVLAHEIQNHMIHSDEFYRFVTLHLSDQQISTLCVLYCIADILELTKTSRWGKLILPSYQGVEFLQLLFSKLEQPKIFLTQLTALIEALDHQKQARAIVYLALDYCFTKYVKAQWNEEKVRIFEQDIKEVKYQSCFLQFGFFRDDLGLEYRKEYSFISPFSSIHPTAAYQDDLPRLDRF